ncbi:MAG: hypothetical protein J7M25_14735 [Deltaproteobacteria bacterium]|nr:hypothetical protein [Deltaproteobacteria bacterium]
MSEIITCPSGLSGRIRGMKVREERVLADRKLAKNGGQVDEVESVEAHERRKFIEELTMRDADFLVDEFDRVDCGVDTAIEIECPECFASQEIDLPFERTFFMPGRERAARRRDLGSSFLG